MNQTPESRCSILYIDDEEKALKYFRMAFASKFRIFTASSGEEGLALLRKEAGSIGVVVSDQRMPGMIGAEVLGCVREEFPHIVRILTTAYSDLESAILAVNKGHIYQYVVKPWDVTELEMVLQRAADYYQILHERNELLRLKMSTLQRIICCDRVKGLLLAFGDGDSESAFRRALLTLIRALRRVPPPEPASGRVFRMDQFDATMLIRRELHSGGVLKSLLTDEPGEAVVLENCKPVSSLGERGGILARDLSRFLSALPGDANASVATPDAAVAVEFSDPHGFVEMLTGALFSTEVSPGAGFLLRLLWSFAEAGLPLTVAMSCTGSEPLTMALVQQPVSSDDVLDALREVFERWDVAAR